MGAKTSAHRRPGCRSRAPDTHTSKVLATTRLTNPPESEPLLRNASWSRAMAGRRNWMPRCRAYARSTGLPCRRKPVLNPDGSIKNGRCPNHGGHSTGPRTRSGHDRCTAARIASYARRRELGLPCFVRKPKPAPAVRASLPPETPEQRRARIIADLKVRFPDRDWD